MRSLTIAVADPALRSDLVWAVRAAGYETEDVSASVLLVHVREGGADTVLLDVTALPDLELISALRAEAPALGIVALGADPSPEVIVEARRRGAQDFLRKPFDLGTLERVLASPAPVAAYHSDEPAFVTGDPKLRQMLDSLGRAAATEATIRIQGESGTGKGLLARWIHRQSRRRLAPLVVVSCAGLSGSMAESELFGHRGGALAGGPESSTGQIQASSGGTLVLDEVSDLDPALQAKLLRALQERELLPLGSSAPEPVDLRVVATTQKDLEREVEAGRFREDLYYRLSVIEFCIPPLRERPCDIELLAHELLERFAREQGGEPARLGERAVTSLLSHPFRGNVRELENLMRRACVVFPAREVDPDVLLSSKPTQPGLEGMRRPLNLRDLEREAIVCSLASSGGNRTHASRALGISVRTLRNKIRQYGLT